VVAPTGFPRVISHTTVISVNVKTREEQGDVEDGSDDRHDHFPPAHPPVGAVQVRGLDKLLGTELIPPLRTTALNGRLRQTVDPG